MILRTLRVASRAAFVVASANFAALVLLGTYDFHIGPLHLYATYLFKPLLYLNAAFLIAFALKAPAANQSIPAQQPEGVVADPAEPVVFGRRFTAGLRFWLIASAIVIAVYAISFTINLDFFDWTHRELTNGRSLLSFFTQRQYDGFYRPLGFCSLWLDNKIFGGALWGYHIQNLPLQVLNGWLAARLAFRLGLEPALARWTGLAFVALPYAFEAVIWPGARFDLLAATFTLLALERALAGAVWAATAAYCLGVWSKEIAYAYPLLIGALWLLRNRLGLMRQWAQWRRLFVATVLATLLLLLNRLLVYGGTLGGYPDTEHGGTINFVLHTKTFTSLFTRLPAVLFLFNTGAGLPIWLRIDLLAFLVFLAIVLFSRASAGRFTVLIALAVVAVLPTANMLGWMTQFAQQGRYVYHSAIWILIPIVFVIGQLPRRTLIFSGWIAIMCTAALFSELVYFRMGPAVEATVADAASACQTATCCRAVALQAVPRDWHGAFYFHAQVRHDLAARLPGVAVDPDPVPPGACTVYPAFPAGRF